RLPRARPACCPEQRPAAPGPGAVCVSLRGGAGRGRQSLKPLAVVTGGSGGIGGAGIAELQERGGDPGSLSRRAGRGGADGEQGVSAFARLPRLDALVNAAAALTKRPFVDLTATEWDDHLGAGLRGAFLCSREAFRRMAPGGTIVMVSSLSGVAGAEKFPG